MSYDFNREWLVKKFDEIERRILKAIEQLDSIQLNWRPDDTSHSISTLVRHIDGNIQERVMNGILHHQICRDRDAEFTQANVTKDELVGVVKSRFQLLLDTVRTLSDADLEKHQQVRGRARTNLDMLHQCAAHFSEHMGQILYIAKMCLKERYQSTSL